MKIEEESQELVDSRYIIYYNYYGINTPKKIKIRRRWHINPKTRVKESRKIYSRKKTKTRLIKELEMEQYL